MSSKLSRNFGRSLHGLKETVQKDWHWVLDEVKTLLAELRPEGSRRLFELWKQIPPQRPGRAAPHEPLDQLRYLLQRLSEYWETYRLFDWDPKVPWNNNRTEQAIGRLKMRALTVHPGWPAQWPVGDGQRRLLKPVGEWGQIVFTAFACDRLPRLGQSY